MDATAIATGAPAWVYVLLVALLALGMRRLTTRDVPVLVALIPTAAFLAWSIFGTYAFAARAGPGIAVTAWLTGALVGALSGAVLPEPRGERLPGGRVRQPESLLPLLLYLGVFIVRFACGAWAAIVPAQANIATAFGIAVGATVTARLLVGIMRWHPSPSKERLHPDE